MSPIAIPLHYDFASCLCYVAHRVMQRMQGDLDDLEIELRWTPLDLTMLTGWRRGDEIAGVRRENVVRVSEELDVPIRIPDRWIDARGAMAVALALEGTPSEVTWRERIWTAVYDEGRELGALDDLERLGREVGIDVSAATSRRGLEALEVRTQLATQADVSGVPTFMFDEWPMGGIQQDATMRSMLERYVAKRRSTS